MQRRRSLLGITTALAMALALSTAKPAAAVVDYNATISGSVVVNGTPYYLGGTSRELSPKFLGPAVLSGKALEDIVVTPLIPPEFWQWPDYAMKWGLMLYPGFIEMATQVGDSGVAGFNVGPHGQLYDSFVVTSVSPYTVAHVFSGSLTLDTTPAVLPFRKRDVQFTWGASGGQGCATLSAEVPLQGIVDIPVTISSTYTLANPVVPTMFFDHSLSIDTVNLGNGDFSGEVVRTHPPLAVPVKIFMVKSGALMKFVSKGTFVLPTAPDDPTVDGGSVRTSDPGAGTFEADLPAASWIALGNPAGSKGYKYKGAGSPADPCKVVLVKSTVIKAVCKGPAVAMPNPASGDVSIDLRAGSTDYRGSCGGTNIKNQSGLIKRKDCPPPTLGCPASPSGAFVDTADLL